MFNTIIIILFRKSLFWQNLSSVLQIQYAGACYDEGQTRRKRLSLKFPGNEVAGTIYDIGSDLPNSNYNVGDRVIIVPAEEEINTGYTEIVPVEDTSRVIQVPNSVPLEVAAMLPGSALTAYAAVNCAKPHVEKLRKVKCKYQLWMLSPKWELQ